MPTLNGPEDTRYFDDDDESKKMPPGKVLQKGKEFNGKNLPFIGYSYVKNATPNITWGLSTFDMTASTVSLAPTKIKEVLKSEGLEFDEMRKAMQALKAEKEKVDLEFNKQKVQKESLKKENDELESRIVQVKSNLEKEVALVLELREAALQQKTFELQLNQMKTTLEAEKQKFKDAESKVNDVTKQRSALEVEINTLQKLLGNQKDSQGSSDATIEGLNLKIITLTDDLKSFHTESESLLEQRKALDSELVSLKATMEGLNKKVSDLDALNSKLEKEKASMNADIDNLKRRVAESTNERESLQKTIFAFENKSTTSDDTSAQQISIDAMKQEILDLTNQKTILNEAFTVITKEKAVWELDLFEISKKLKVEQESHNETRTKLVSFGSKFSLMATQVKQLEDMKAKFEKATTNAKVEAEKVSLKLKDERNDREVLQLKAAETEKQYELLLKDHQNLQDKINLMSIEITSKESQLINLDLITHAETNIRVQLAEQKATALINNTDLNQEIERLLAKIQNMQLEQQETSQAHETALVSLRNSENVTVVTSPIEQYEIKIATLQKELHDKTTLQEDLSHEYKTLSMMYSRVQQEYVDFKHSITNNLAVSSDVRESKDFSEIFSTSVSPVQDKRTSYIQSTDHVSVVENQRVKPENAYRRSMNFFNKSRSKSNKDQEILALKKLDDMEESSKRERNESLVSELSSGQRSMIITAKIENIPGNFKFIKVNVRI